MRILKVLLMAALAIAAVATGLFAVALLAVAVVAYVVVRWVRARFGGRPAASRSQPDPQVAAPRGDVIDVAATEVREPPPPAERRSDG